MGVLRPGRDEECIPLTEHLGASPKLDLQAAFHNVTDMPFGAPVGRHVWRILHPSKDAIADSMELVPNACHRGFPCNAVEVYAVGGSCLVSHTETIAE